MSLSKASKDKHITDLGRAEIISGLLSFAILHSKAAMAPWRIFMLTTGALTFIVACWYALCFPDSPMNARFLSHEEKIMYVARFPSLPSPTRLYHIF